MRMGRSCTMMLQLSEGWKQQLSVPSEFGCVQVVVPVDCIGWLRNDNVFVHKAPIAVLIPLVLVDGTDIVVSRVGIILGRIRATRRSPGHSCRRNAVSRCPSLSCRSGGDRRRSLLLMMLIGPSPMIKILDRGHWDEFRVDFVQTRK